MTGKGLVLGIAAAASLFASAQAQQVAPPPYGAPIGGDRAQTAINAAEAEARQNHWTLSFAVVDTYGAIVMLKRMDGAPPFTVDVAIKKAKTANTLRAPSKTLADAVEKGGPPTWMVIPDLAPIEGGVPILVGGQVVGAIGASGAASFQDAQTAMKGAAALK